MNERDFIDNNLTLRLTRKDQNRFISQLALSFVQKKMNFYAMINKKIAAKYAWKVFTTPQKRKTSVQLSTIKNKTLSQVSILGHKIQTYIQNSQGNRKVLVVHGWGSQANDFDSLILSLLDHRFKVVSFDSPAHGFSSGKSTNAVEVSQIIQHLNKVHGGFDAIISHSFGSIASSLALSNMPESKAKLVTIGSPNKLSTVLHEFQQIIKMDWETQLAFHLFIEKKFQVKIDDFSVEKFISKIISPTLLIHDEYDKQVPISRALEITQSNPQIDFFRTYGLGHNRIYKDSIVLEKIIDFIK